MDNICSNKAKLVAGAAVAGIALLTVAFLFIKRRSSKEAEGSAAPSSGAVSSDTGGNGGGSGGDGSDIGPGECWCCYVVRKNDDQAFPCTVRELRQSNFSVFGSCDHNNGAHNVNIDNILKELGYNDAQRHALMGTQALGKLQTAGFTISDLTLRQMAQTHLYHRANDVAHIKPKTSADIVAMKTVLATPPEAWEQDCTTFKPQEIAAIKEYTGAGFSAINKDLIFQVTDSPHLDTMRWLYHLQSRKAAIPYINDDNIPELTWRVTNMTATEFAWYQVGKTYVVDSFLSTAKVLLDWWPGNAVFVFTIKNKATLLDVEHLSTFTSEKEVLFLYGTQIKVVSTKKDDQAGGKYYVVCDVVCTQ